MTTPTVSTYRNLQLERSGAVTVLRIHRPDVLNALNRETLSEIEDAANAFRSDPEQGALIVTGSGEKSFVSGADINELAVLGPAAAQDISQFGQRVFDVLERATKPVIAAVNGYAFGGGCELALACHIRLASDNAVFGLPEVSLGIIPGYGGTQRLPRLVGEAKALEMNLTGEAILAEEAYRLGLVHAVVPDHELLDTALNWAGKLAGQPPVAIEQVKTVSHKGDLDDGIAAEKQGFATAFASEDAREGIGAFIQKRKAKFKGK